MGKDWNMPHKSRSLGQEYVVRLYARVNFDSYALVLQRLQPIQLSCASVVYFSSPETSDLRPHDARLARRCEAPVAGRLVT